jgi:hypothetical protein
MKKNSHLILLMVCGTVFCAQSKSFAGEACQELVAKLAKLDVNQSTELINSRVNKPYSKLYAECDKLNTFNGQPLPLFQGKRLKCSTDANRVDFIRKFPDGTIVFRSKMGVDADGSPFSQSASWPNQPHTSLHYDTGSKDFVNAEDVSFVVIPQNDDKFRASFGKDTGVVPGDLALVVKGNQCSFAVIADQGPAYRIGEASMKTHEELGNPQCKIKGQHPCKQLKAGGGGISIDSGVTYILFPRSRPKPLNAATVSAVTAKDGKAKTLEFLDKFQQ